MKKTPLLLLISLFFTVFSSFGQIQFNTQYGGSLNEDGRWMEQMPDSGFILTGGTVTYSNGQTDMWLVRTDKYGNVMWTKSIGGSAFDFANMVKPTTNGFVLCGVTNRNGSDDAIIVRTNNSGNVIWETVLGDGNIQWFEGLIETADGGYAAVGVNNGAGTNGHYDIWLVKFNSAGTKLWEKSIGGGSYEIGNSIRITPDGGFILSGQSYSYGQENGDFYLVKTDSLGNVQWFKNYDQPGIQECHYACCTPDGGYVMVGDADSLPNGLGDTDVWLVKTDSAGNILWDKVLGGNKKDGGKTVEVTSDGGLIIAGITRSFGLINPNYYLVKTDPNGVLEWQLSSYGTTHHDHAYRGIETSDGGFAEFGYFRNAASTMDFALVKLGPNGGITKDISVEEIDAPLPNLCRSAAVPLTVKLTNFGATNEVNIPVTIEINNGSTVTSYTDTFAGALAPTLSTTLTFSSTHDFTVDGTYSIKAYTTHRNGDISYTNDTAYLTVNVIPPVGDPTTVSAASCVNAALTLSATPAASTDSMFWFDNGGDLIATGNTYTTPTLSSTQTYFVQSMKGKGNFVGPVDKTIGTGAGSTSNGGIIKFDSRKDFILVSVKVFPTTSGNRIIELRDAANNLLEQKTVNLPAAPGGIRVFLNFHVPPGNDLQLKLGSGSANLFRNSDGATFPYSVSQTLEIYGTNSSSSDTYYYFYDWYVYVPSQGCESNSVPVQGVITNGSASAFDQSRCGPGPLTLTANSNFSLSWYDQSSGGNLLHSGNTYTTPSLSSTQTYYLQISGCANRIPVDAIINSQSSPPSASNVIHCGPGNVTLTASSPDSINWYSAATNGVLLGSGSQYITPYLNATTTYYVSAGASCPSTRVAVDAIIDAANPPTVTGQTACGPASVTLGSSSPDPVRWYTVPTGGSPISTNYNYTTPVLAAPKTYYVEAGTTCSSVRVPVVANIIVSDPPVGTNGSRCGSGTVVISAQSTSSITWWTAPSGGSQVGSGATFTTPSISSTTTYYAMGTVSGCPSTRAAVIAFINITTPPVGTSGARCGTGTVNISASSADTIYWFANSSGGSSLFTGSNFTTPSISTTTTYYAQASMSCPSVRTAVVATVSTGAATPVTTDTSRCGNGTVTLTASSTDPITWYNAPSGGTQVGTGSTFTTPSLSSTTTYYAVAGVTGCFSSAVAAVAIINPTPTAPLTTGNSNCGPGSLTLNASASNPVSWYTAPTGGSPISTGSSYTANFNTTTTLYVSANDGTCSSTRVPVTATIYTLPVVNLGPDTIVINSGQTISLDAGAGFTSYQWNTGATTRTINVSVDGTYSVTVTDNHNCTGSDQIVVRVMVGIQENEISKSLSVYPNPASGMINITVNNNQAKFDLYVTDVVGQILISENHKDNSIFNRNYDLSSFAKGMYFIKLTSDDGNATRTFILQ